MSETDEVVPSKVENSLVGHLVNDSFGVRGIRVCLNVLLLELHEIARHATNFAVSLEYEIGGLSEAKVIKADCLVEDIATLLGEVSVTPSFGLLNDVSS